MRKRILILDDDHSNADVLTFIMKEDGFEALSIFSVADLLPTIKMFNPHLLFLDINLGHFDGRIICNYLKKNPETQHLPVILISAMLPNQIQEIVSNEDGLINKPFEINEVSKMVKKLLR
ncbi:MAG: response regulator [Pedobacter sp.]|nr:MAG: response regulator [Pedobacter sp.]